jgi:hypothetical protein
LLACGLAYAAWYVISNDVIAATYYEGYSRMDQAVSELSATSAPTQTFLNAAVPFSTALLIAFGVGVWRASKNRRMLRVTAAAFVAQALTFPIWMLFPMSSRKDMVAGAAATNDIGHIALTVITIALIMTQIVTGAIAIDDRRFRLFSIAMATSTLVFGATTGVLSADIASGDPTPSMGLLERISIGAWLVWIGVLSVLLLRERANVTSAPERGLETTSSPRT